MAADGKIAAPTNDVIALAEIVSKLLPSFFGKTTTESGTGSSSSTLSETGTGATKKSIDPATQAQLDTLLGTSMANATGTAQSDAIVQNILRKAGIAFAPTLALRNQAGLHNDSVTAQLQTEAIAAAVGESSQAVLSAQQQAAATASGLIKTSAEGNSTAASTTSGAKTGASATSENKTATTSPTLGGTNPLNAILMAGLTVYGGQKLKKFIDPYFDSLFGSDGGSLTAGNSATSAAPTGLEAAEAGSSVVNSADVASTAAAVGTTPEAGTLGFANSDAVTAGVAGVEDAASVTNTIVPDSTVSGSTEAVDAVTGATPAFDANGAVLPSLSGAEGAVTGQANASLASVLDSSNIPAMDTVGAINKLAGTGEQVADAGAGASGVTSDVTSGLYTMPPATSDLVDLATTDLSGTGGTAASGVTEVASAAGGAEAASAAASVAGSAFIYPLTFALGDFLGSDAEVAKNKAQVQAGIKQYGSGDAFAAYTAANTSKGGEDYVDANSSTIDVNGSKYGRGTLDQIFAHGLEDSLSSDVKDAYQTQRQSELNANSIFDTGSPG